MYEVHISMTFHTKTRERAEFIIKSLYKARKRINKLDITDDSKASSNIIPGKED